MLPGNGGTEELAPPRRLSSSHSRPCAMKIVLSSSADLAQCSDFGSFTRWNPPQAIRRPPGTTLEALAVDRRQFADVTSSPFCRHDARNLRVFGSVARGEARDTSDLDLLVEWDAGRSFLDHVALVQDLEELLGTKVHVGTEPSLHWYVRDRILREATPL